MQKIQVYLVPNRITVTTDVTGFITEFRQVYQRKLKLYKGIDNNIEFEVRDSEQRKQNVMGYSIIVKFFDASHKNLFSVQGSPIVGKPGLMTATITADDIALIDPQLLKMAAYLRNDDEEKLIYSDAQFDVFGTVEILNGYNELEAQGDVVDVLKTFNYEFDSVLRTSEIGRFGTRLNNDYSTTGQTISVDVYLNEGIPFYGDITIQATKDKSTASSVRWENVGTVTVPDGTTGIYTFPVDNDSDEKYLYIRFQHKKGGLGMDATFDVVRSGGVYSVTLNKGGAGYNIGDKIVIRGSKLDGVDNVNDLIITVTAIDTPNSYYRKSVATFNYSGVAAAGNGTYTRVPSDSSAGIIDKIVIRN